MLCKQAIHDKVTCTYTLAGGREQNFKPKSQQWFVGFVNLDLVYPVWPLDPWAVPWSGRASGWPPRLFWLYNVLCVRTVLCSES
jgi:hypothetical protein